MRWVIREASVADSSAVARLSEQLGYPNTRDEIEGRMTMLLPSADHGVFVAEGDGREIVGWVHIMRRPLLIAGGTAEIGGLVVDERYRRKGVGKALIREAEHWASSRGYTTLVVRSNVLRHGAHGFYQSQGYRETKTQKVFVKQLET